MSDSQKIHALDGTSPDPLDDPRLTALALGELSDAGLAALEADLDDLARRDVRREADEIARFAASLGAALRTDEAGLDSGRRAAILAASLGVAKRATVLPLPAARARVLRRVVQWSAGGAVAAGLALTVVPNLVEARKHGNEAAAIGALKTTNSAETLFREGDKEPQTPLDYGSIAQISNTTLIDGVLGNTRKQGYTFQLPAPTVSGEFLWFANANPNAPTSTSDRYFCTNHSGVIYYEQRASGALITGDVPTHVLPVEGERDSRLEQVDMGTSFASTNGQFMEERSYGPAAPGSKAPGPGELPAFVRLNGLTGPHVGAPGDQLTQTLGDVNGNLAGGATDYVYRSKDVPLVDDGNPDYEDGLELSPGLAWRGGADVPGRWKELADRYAANARIDDYELSSAGLGTARVQVDGVWYDLPTSKPTPTASTTLEGLYTDGWRPTPLIETAKERQSTFAIDVDTASYARVRSSIRTQGRWPAASTVRVEELVNYHAYDYAAPTDGRPLAASSEVTTCPWAPDRRLVRIGLRGRGLEGQQRPAANLVFLIDVSGSMGSVEKLPLVQRALALLVSQLGERDRVSIVVYAGASGCVLDGASGADKATILGALERLQAGGSTNGGAGIELAYELCSRRFVEGGVNRVILCTDGDWNVGAQSQQALEELIARKAKGNLSLTALGFGMSEGGDRTLETLADRGDGNYAYVDGLPEARRVLVEQLDGTLVTIGKDVKVQVEWDPAAVTGYTLVGYEDRRLANQDFANDAKDAGDVGARHAVTALYEVKTRPGATNLGTLRLRWKAVTAGQAAQASELLEVPLTDDGRTLERTSADTRFAAGVAAFALGLRAGPGPGRQLLDVAQALADGARGADPHGLRADFSELVRTARGLGR